MSDTKLQKILIVTSTLPATADDPVPAFVSEQVVALKKRYPELELHVLAPHNAYAKTRNQSHEAYQEYRFHYLWPSRLELLAGRGIAPALKAHKWLYLAIPFLFLFEAIATYRLARRLKPDVLYVHWFMLQAVATFVVARLLKLPFIFTTHASDVAVLKKIPGTKKLVRAICKQAVAYTAVSKQTADRLRWFWPAHAPELEAKLSIIPMGTDLQVAAPDTSGGTEKIITFIGRLVERKGVADLISATKTIQAVDPSVRLIIAGDGQDRARFESLAQQAGINAEFPGYVTGDAKTDLLARTDVLCLPSMNEPGSAEGLPVVLMEGLTAGKLVVATDATGAQEYLTDQRDGFVVPEQNVEALTDALHSALTLLPAERAAMQSGARAIAAHFAWPHVAEQHYTVLQDAYAKYHARA